MAVINNRELSNASNSADPAIKKLMQKNNESTQNNSREKTVEQKHEENKQNFLKLITASFKYQDPENPASTEELTQTFAALTQTDELISVNKNLADIKNSLSKTELSKAIDFQGKKVDFDTGHKFFDGDNPVEFSYNLKFDPKNRPSNSQARCSITILSDSNHPVYKAQGTVLSGKNSFRWDGKSISKKIADSGEYHIKIEAFWEQDIDGSKALIPIEGGAFESGVVDSAEIKDGKAVLNIGKQKIRLDDIVKVYSDENSDKNLKTIADYSSYIGKTAEIKSDRVKISSSNGAISFNCNFDMPGKAKIKLYDNNNNIASITYVDNVKKGLNNINFKPHSAYTDDEAEELLKGKNPSKIKVLADNEYRYEIYVEDSMLKTSDRFIKIDNTRKALITGLDFRGKDHFALTEFDKFNIADIKLLSATENQNIIADAAGLIGKTVTLKNDIIDFEGSDITKTFTLDKNISDNYGDGILKIYDLSSKLISEIRLDRSILLSGDDPFYDKELIFNYLTDDSKKALFKKLNITLKPIDYLPSTIDEVSQYFSSNDITLSIEDFKIKLNEFYYNNLNTSEKFLNLNYEKIYHGFSLLTIENQKLLKNAININKKVNTIKWDGKTLNNNYAKHGKYKYELLVEKVDFVSGETKVSELIRIKEDSKNLYIKEFKLEDTDLKFVASEILAYENGSLKISDYSIDFTKDEIATVSI